ncbi:MAG: hypothetical protein HFE68_03975 [Erysipelotrichaceae bacterium]|nr:hypothetical protein [Erysipelotrichaceae bacterium]MCI9312504.1 hypothetical protein [Erysipelotrichaceae bacterium]
MNAIALKKRHLSIHTYGYDYTKQDFIITVSLFCTLTAVICFLHKLNVLYTLIVLATLVCLLPLLISGFFLYKKEKARFEAYCRYFEYMKIYFKTYKKIKIALEHAKELFPDRSLMYACISKAIHEISESGDYAKALAYIEKEFHNSYLRRLHQLFITGEQHGSDTVYENLDLINYEAWKEDMRLHQNRKRVFRYMLYGMTLFALALSYYGVAMFADSAAMIYHDSKYQLYTFLDVEGILLLFMLIYTSFVNKKWIRSDD